MICIFGLIFSMPLRKNACPTPKRDRGEGEPILLSSRCGAENEGSNSENVESIPRLVHSPPPNVNLISLSKPWYILSPHNLPKANFFTHRSKINILSYAKKEDIKQVLLQIHLVIQRLCCDSNLSVTANVIVSVFERTLVSNCMLFSWNVNIKTLISNWLLLGFGQLVKD